MQEWYHGWWWKSRRMTRVQIEEMLKNMKKTWIINKKSNEYHTQEEKEAEDILKKIQDNNK
jgi:hypothetical protein